MAKLSTLSYDLSPPGDWESRCSKHRCLFHCTDWHKVLQQGFSTKTLYIWEPEGNIAVTISTFKAGPFRVGYLGFPVGGSTEGKLTPQFIEQIRYINLPLDVLRIPVSSFDTALEIDYPSVTTPETAIVNLKDWQLSNLPKLRRDINKAHRTPVDIRDIKNVDQSLVIYDLYRKTVLAKNGRLKYTQQYFQSLVNLSTYCNNLRCIAAFDAQQLIGFVVIALDKNMGYYLHGATDIKGKSAGVSDLLVQVSIEWAQQQGMTQFNLMSSPATQTGLIRYKEKFGAQTRPHNTYEISISTLRAGLFRIANGIHKNIETLVLARRRT